MATTTPVLHGLIRVDVNATTPRVSILLPAFNAASTLPACLRSILRQLETRWECVIVDDGSTDATRTVAEQFARADVRFRVIALPHQGLVETLNAGIAQCRARLIARMDADDLMHRRRLLEQANALEHAPDLVAVGCHVRLFPRQPLTDGRRNYERWLNGHRTAADIRREAFIECPLAHPTWMMRREVLEAYRYRARGWPEDYDLLLQLLTAGLEIGVVPERLLCWRDGPGRLSRTDAAYGLERFTACKAAFLCEGFLAGVERYILWGYGGTGRALCRAIATHGRHPSHIVEVHPRRLGQIIQGAPVIPPEGLRGRVGQPVVVSVSGERPRTQIREAMRELGFLEGRDFVCAA